MAKKLVFCGWDVASGSSRPVCVIRRSPSHICRVMKGERSSVTLFEALKRVNAKKGGK